VDKIIRSLTDQESKRQKETLMMIPSENYSSKEVRAAAGSVLMHKYSEGYPGKRYYQGNKFIDEIENIAIERAQKLFGVPHANVQALSGSPANTAVYMALLSPADVLMGMSLSAGGHLTHGHPNITFSGKYFKSVQYGVNDKGFIDYEEVKRLALKSKPKLIVAGLTAYPRNINWIEFAKIADSVGAVLMADISHIAGLIAAGVLESPVKHADVITTTTHKTLRGPRGAIIMVTRKGLKKDPEMSKKIDRAVFPGLQGGPHDNTTAAIAIALGEAEKPSFKRYAKNVLENAQALAHELSVLGFKLITNGTDNHLILIDLRSRNITGGEAAQLLEEAGIIINRNSIPNDPAKPMNPSGIRLGTPSVTTRGMGKREMKQIAGWINEVITNKDSMKNKKISLEVKKLCKKFAIS
jgi:glycine hydroxymethyltransferase